MHSWNKSTLGQGINPLYMLLNLIFTFSLGFSGYSLGTLILRGFFLLLLWLVMLASFGIRVIHTSENKLGSAPSSSIFKVCEGPYDFSLKYLIFTTDTSWAWTFPLWKKYFITVSISLLVIDLPRFSVSSSLSFAYLCSRNLFMSSKLLKSMAKVCS